MNSQEIVSIYEHVAELSAQMVSAAQNHNWELLSRLELSCQTQMQAIQDVDMPVVLERTERERKVGFLKKILADDRKIRDLIQPEMARLGELINGPRVHNGTTNAYQLDHRS